MEEEFYKGRLSQNYGLEVNVPDAQAREMIHRVIYDELALGRIEQDSKAKYLGVIEQMVRQGVEGVILGCTEIGLLVQQEDSRVPLFDTARIHAEAAVEYALKG
jgi:aspartate racemase